MCCALALAGCPAAENGDAVKGVNNARVASAPESADVLADQVISLVNQSRTQHGLNPLRKGTALTKLAEDYAARMITGGFFAHTDPQTGEGPLQRALHEGCMYLAVGENLAAGQTSPEAAIEDWMSSEEHRKTILSAQWDEVGVAVRTGGEYGVYWVMEFGNVP
jgi:uncharacterized protein YkwD